MAKDLGWIKLYRSSFNNKLYFSEPFTRWQAWTDLLLIANHSEGFVRVRGIKQVVLRGQIGYSSPVLGKRWTWSKGRVVRFLDELEDEHQVVLQKNNVTTLISIVNYNKYQLVEFANDTANSIANVLQMIPQMIPQTDTNKNDNNENNGKNEKKLASPESFPNWKKDAISFINDEPFKKDFINQKKIGLTELEERMWSFVFKLNDKMDFKNTAALKVHFKNSYAKHVENGVNGGKSLSNGFIEVPVDFDYNGEDVLKW